MDLLPEIKKRRSIRRYQDKDVPKELVNKIIEAGIWAPSSNHSEPVEFIIVRDPKIKKELSKTSSWSGFINDAPVAVVVISDKSSSCVIRDGSNAAMSMLLEIHSLGLGSCWVDPQYNVKKVKDVLGIPNNYEIIGMFPIGYPTESPKSSRKSLDEAIHKDKF